MSSYKCHPNLTHLNMIISGLLDVFEVFVSQTAGHPPHVKQKLFLRSCFWVLWHFLSPLLSPSSRQHGHEAMPPLWGHLPAELRPEQIRGARGEPLENLPDVQRAVPAGLRPEGVWEPRAHPLWRPAAQLWLERRRESEHPSVQLLSTTEIIHSLSACTGMAILSLGLYCLSFSYFKKQFEVILWIT